ncbi:MAG: NADH:ubiquinone reductase (Na(+)-transporting) subunit B [Bacteroidales bacterium]
MRKFLDKIKPNFEKGGKLHMFQSVFDGFETFLFVPKETCHNGAHIRDNIDLKRTMIVVVMALMPAFLFGTYNVGHQHYLSIGDLASQSIWSMFLYGLMKVLPIVIVSYLVGLGIEFYFAQKRGHGINEGFLVSGLLIPLVLPPTTPLWMVALATAFAVILGKEVFGGTGMNIWNPALIARAFLFFAYPGRMSGDTVWIANNAGDKIVDGFTSATPLARLAASESGASSFSIIDSITGLIPGSIGETSVIAILIGAIILIWTGIGSWKIMLATVVGALGTGMLFNLAAGDNLYMAVPAWHHLVIGGFVFGAVFMATDPVSAAQTETGKWIYGILIGVFVMIFRVLNPAFPEGMMLAILLMNTFAPLIDHYVVQANVNRRLKRAKVKAN